MQKCQTFDIQSGKFLFSLKKDDAGSIIFIMYMIKALPIYVIRSLNMTKAQRKIVLRYTSVYEALIFFF